MGILIDIRDYDLAYPESRLTEERWKASKIATKMFYQVPREGEEIDLRHLSGRVCAVAWSELENLDEMKPTVYITVTERS